MLILKRPSCWVQVWREGEATFFPAGKLSPMQAFKYSVNFSNFKFCLPQPPFPATSLALRAVSLREGLLFPCGMYTKVASDFSGSHSAIPCLVVVAWWSSTDHIVGFGWWHIGLIYHILVCIAIMGNTFGAANQFSVFLTTTTTTTTTTTILYWICTKNTNS